MKIQKHFFLLLILFKLNITMANIQYTISFPEASNHYCSVSVEFIATQNQPIVGMPVWAPGSYLVREFSKSMEALKSNHSFKKIRKNQWKIDAKRGDTVKFEYKVYGNEVSVRTNIINEHHAFLSPPATLVYVKNQMKETHEVKIKLPKNWKKVACGLQENVDSKTWVASDYDLLADAPIEAGNHDEFDFTVQGVKHRVAMVGQNNADYSQLAKDMKKMVETTIQVWGKLPVKKYLFIVEHVENGGGGLEHLNSTVLMMSRNNYSDPDKYVNFISLVSHEYFHLWNVKRLRPIELGPFDYDNENYTELLWFFEGFTAYYDELLLYRGGFISQQDYLNRLAVNIERTENRPGVKVQNLADASYDAWIKAYRRNENSANTTISYYGKGSLVALLLDIEICASTNGKHNLDALMRRLYQLYEKNPHQGITEEQIIQAAGSLTGRSMGSFFHDHVHSTKDFDYVGYLQKAGIQMEASKDQQKVELGTSSKLIDGKLIVQQVKRGTAAYLAGINAGDELVSINNERISDLSKQLSRYKVGNVLEVQVFRDGLPLNKKVTLMSDSDLKVKLMLVEGKMSAAQTKTQSRWLTH